MYIRSFNDNKENLGKGNIIDNSSKAKPIILMPRFIDNKFKNISIGAIKINQIFIDNKFIYHIRDMSMGVLYSKSILYKFNCTKNKITLLEHINQQKYIKSI